MFLPRGRLLYRGKMLRFAIGKTPQVNEFRDLLTRSTLAERRPVEDQECLQQMLEGANLIVTCRSEGLLVGIARSVTDHAYCCYLSDLAVDEDFQKQGIGKRLIALTQENLGPKCKIILLSAPKAAGYYPRIGFEPHASAWVLPRTKTTG